MLPGADLSDSDLRGADFSLCNAQKASIIDAALLAIQSRLVMPYI